MSFDPGHDDRWKRIFLPAIEGSTILGKNLRAVRVDVRNSGDSILTEIISGIAHAQLILADISVTHECEKGGELCCYRNSNVMYEVGLGSV